MNRIVRKHYPVSKLPADLREGFGDRDRVVVTVEAQAGARAGRPISEILAATARERALDEDPAARIRKLRTGWSRRERLNERIRRGDDL